MRFGWRCAMKPVGVVCAAGVLVAAALGTLVKTIVESEDDWTEAPEGGLHRHRP